MTLERLLQIVIVTPTVLSLMVMVLTLVAYVTVPIALHVIDQIRNGSREQ